MLVDASILLFAPDEGYGSAAAVPTAAQRNRIRRSLTACSRFSCSNACRLFFGLVEPRSLALLTNPLLTGRRGVVTSRPALQACSETCSSSR
jgi:hypothetical protein